MNQLIQTFPIVPYGFQEGIMNDLRMHSELQLKMREERVLREAHKNLVDGMNEVSMGYRKYFPKKIADLTYVEQQIAIVQMEIEEIEEKRQAESGITNEEEPADLEEDFEKLLEEHEEIDNRMAKKRKKSIRKYYGLISRLCHPDKTSHVEDPELRNRMHDIFMQAKGLYEDKDLESLVDLYAEATLIASGRTAEQVQEDLAERIRHLDNKIQGLNRDIEFVQSHPVFIVYTHHKEGNIGKAKSFYNHILSNLMYDKDNELTQLKRKLAYMKENDSWTTL